MLGYTHVPTDESSSSMPKICIPFHRAIAPSLTGAPSHHPIIHHACNDAHDDAAHFLFLAYCLRCCYSYEIIWLTGKESE
jgi:hypothetical protein